VENTHQRLTTAGFTNVQLFCQGHETVSTVLAEQEEIKAAIFNLGYLPKSDKEIITQADTTLVAIQTILQHLTIGDRIVIVIYYGHDGEIAEKEAVLAFAEALPQENYTALTYQFINQRNAPPILLTIEKKKHGRN